MFKNLINSLSVGAIAWCILWLTGDRAQAIPLSNYQDDLGQVTNVNQLRDVAPTDWAYEALRSLVDRYGCIAGFPNQTYRGSQPLSRYEFAAGLNSCLNQIERLIASSGKVTNEDLATLNRLTQEFESELATLGGRVDELESRTAIIEDNSFSTTTKLNGEIYSYVLGTFGDQKPDGTDVEDQITFLPNIPNWLFGIIVAAVVGVVIIGGITRIASVTDKIVPLMAVLYVAACLWIILSNITQLPSAIATIFIEAFSPQAVGGGIVGVMVQGIRRSAFSNEAGVGSAAIAHSAARTDEPLREGIVALLEPLIDTIIICNMTALVIVITGTYRDSSVGDGVLLTSRSFATIADWFPILLAIAVALFAFSTMISWSYYGERAWEYLFGNGTILVYKALFVFFTFVGSVVNLGAVVDFSDMMILAMSIPNLIGCYLLSGVIAIELKDYMHRLNSGQMPTYTDQVALRSDSKNEITSR
jgi:hypothetical protein